MAMTSSVPNQTVLDPFQTFNLLRILEIGFYADLLQIRPAFRAHVLHDGRMLAFLDLENDRSSWRGKGVGGKGVEGVRKWGRGVNTQQ